MRSSRSWAFAKRVDVPSAALLQGNLSAANEIDFVRVQDPNLTLVRRPVLRPPAPWPPLLYASCLTREENQKYQNLWKNIRTCGRQTSSDRPDRASTPTVRWVRSRPAAFAGRVASSCQVSGPWPEISGRLVKRSALARRRRRHLRSENQPGTVTMEFDRRRQADPQAIVRPEIEKPHVFFSRRNELRACGLNWCVERFRLHTSAQSCGTFSRV
jgi:hypothetical protein